MPVLKWDSKWQEMALILHAGGSKTGSTSVRSALRSRRSLLCRHRISLAWRKQRKSRRDSGALSDRSLFYAVHRGGRPHQDRNRFSSQEAYEAFRVSQADALHEFLVAKLRRGMHVIVSDEYLFQLDGETLGCLARFLEAAGHDDVRVIVSVREPASLYLSLVQQNLKADCRLADPFSWRYHDFDCLDAWERVFRGRLEVRAFDRLALPASALAERYGIRFASEDASGQVAAAPSGALRPHHLIANLDAQAAEQLRLHCLAELCAMDAP